MLALSVVFTPAGLGQDRPVPVSVISVIATPEKFDGELLTVEGFLSLAEHPEFYNDDSRLYLHEEDATNLILTNAIWVVPSAQMQRDREKIDLMYVLLTGVFHVSNQKPMFKGGIITDVRSCISWSDPKRPRGTRRYQNEK
jgi:hypothetical protein